MQLIAMHRAARIILSLLLVTLTIAESAAIKRVAVVADSLTHKPLPRASVFSSKGVFIGTTASDGTLSCAVADDYPLTVRYIGYSERTVSLGSDTVFMQESVTVLPEMLVESRQKKVLHILAYVREYSTLSGFTDTITMFREKMVDYMLPTDSKMRFRGWRTPRVLNARSYYRFTNVWGLDSVSDRCNQHFTWSDWIGIPHAAHIPQALAIAENGTDTLPGRYGPTEIWTRNADRITVDIDVLSDSAGRRWMPYFSAFLRYDDIDFERLRLKMNYSYSGGDVVEPAELTGFSCNIESRGRGNSVFLFNRSDEPFFVNTYTEAYILDREYITAKEAKTWEKRQLDSDVTAIYEPAAAPAIDPSVQILVDRVNNIDCDSIRQQLAPDERLVGRHIVKQNFSIGHRALFLLRQLTGISQLKSKRNFERRWKEMKDSLRH